MVQRVQDGKLTGFQMTFCQLLLVDLGNNPVGFAQAQIEAGRLLVVLTIDGCDSIDAYAFRMLTIYGFL